MVSFVIYNFFTRFVLVELVEHNNALQQNENI